MGLELRAIQSPIFSEPIDFTFHAQAFTLLVGSSGSGKSSLFQMIAQVSSLPYSGQVLINGSEVSQLSITSNVFVTYSVLYQAERCDGCPLRGSCFKARGNRIIEVNHQLQQYKLV